MADYNPKTVAAYQQYASSMKAGGGGTNLSGSGAKAPPKMQTEYGNRKGLGSPTSRLDKKGYTPTTSLSTASGIEYIDNVSSEKDLPSANPAAILYSAAANANMAAGVTQTPSPLTPMNGMSLYSMKKMTEVVPQVTPYLYRVDMQEQAQDLVEQAMGYEPPLAQMAPNRQVWDYEKYSSLSSEEKDKAAEALQIVGERKMTPAEIKQFQPLIDMANEIANETITVEELAPLTQMDQEAKLKDILEVIESGGLSRITNIREVRLDNEVDPITGKPIGGDELGFTDVSPAEEAPDQLGLMSRSRVPTGSIEEAVREAYNLEEEPAVEAVATDENFLETPTFKLLEGVEGFKSKPYSLNNYETLGGKPHKSGLTVGAGIDFGQHSEQTLLDMGIPKTMVDKAKDAGWIGLNPDTIVDPKTGEVAATRARGHELMYDKFVEQKKAGTLPTFTDAELSQATPPVYQTYEDAAREQYETDTGLNFDDLNEGSKAVLTLEKYHRGVNYDLPQAMLIGAAENNPDKAAQGTKSKTRRKNLKAWLKKVGLNYETRRETSPRPMLRPTE